MFYLLLATFIIVGEISLKNRMEGGLSFSRSVPAFQRIPFLQGKILLRKYHNKGAFLNMMEKKKKLLHLISLLFTLVITLLFLFTLFQKGNKLLKLGLTLLLGGAFSNTYDRLCRGYVVDYFSFRTPFERFNRIVFNISDFCIIIGSLLLVVSDFLPRSQ